MNYIDFTLDLKGREPLAVDQCSSVTLSSPGYLHDSRIGFSLEFHYEHIAVLQKAIRILFEQRMKGGEEDGPDS